MSIGLSPISYCVGFSSGYFICRIISKKGPHLFTAPGQSTFRFEKTGEGLCTSGLWEASQDKGDLP